MRRAALALALVPLAACAPEVEVGRALYAERCAACHGPTGLGDGPAATGIAVPDITTLTARNGGTYPQVYVMAVIDGYNREGEHGSLMPVFGPELAEGDLVGVEVDPGVLTPTPARLVALAAYIETLQR
ncbi:cytochrome c [Rhodobacteraceae bacterium CCMM004]|nr:cytochrome c [Rhodobacteraceae bacterium CCMM004]